MKNMQILDCTLRDGGYCNEWEFGYSNISKIINKLDAAGIDIIECGFLTNKNADNHDLSRYKTLRDLGSHVNTGKKAKLVVMANYGEYDFHQLPENEGIVDGIRVAFHKDDWEKALEACRLVQEKGYLVFAQPMVSLRYSEEEFLNLIKEINAMNPYAFYIVDSFGSMKQEELEKLYIIANEILKADIILGFHAHNNMQLARANAEWLIENCAGNRNILIDSSVCGMGRGAGNLNTELIAEYLNSVKDTNYNVKSILEIIDEVILDFYEKKYWGYSLPNFLSAKYNLHPNYAEFLEGKKTLTYKEMCEIFENFMPDKKYEFDKEYIEKAYIQYLDNKSNSKRQSIGELKKLFQGKEVLLIAPGSSVGTEESSIRKFMDSGSGVAVSVNFKHPNIDTDFVFFSNIRRYRQADTKGENVIITSNIGDNVDYVIPYKKYLNSERGVEDNAVLMFIRFLMDCDVGHIYLAGVDGYAYDMEENYLDESLQIAMSRKDVREKNRGIEKTITALRKSADIDFITATKLFKTEEK